MASEQTLPIPPQHSTPAAERLLCCCANRDCTFHVSANDTVTKLKDDVAHVASVGQVR